MHKKLLPLILLAILPFFIFLIVFNRRQESLTRNNDRLGTPTNNEAVNRNILSPSQLEEVKAEFDSVERLQRGTIIGFDAQNQVVDVLAIDILSETNEVQEIQIDVSSTSRFACWNSEQHNVAKTAFFPLQPDSYLSLNGEEIVENINFSNQTNNFAFFKISGISTEGLLKSEQVAIIDCG